MKKIRINELARELEVKAHEILDRLPELGVSEKKTHSSSIDEDVALKLRRIYGFDAPEPSDHEEDDASADVDRAEEHAPAPAPNATSPVAAPPQEEAPLVQEAKPAEEAPRPTGAP